MRVWVITLVVTLAITVVGDYHEAASAEQPVADTTTAQAPIQPEVENNSVPEKENLVMPPDILQFMSEVDAYWLAIEVNDAAAEYSVPVKLCWEVIRKESGFHHIRPDGTIKRNPELGICQILSDGMAIKKRHNILDRADNIRCMADMLAFALQTRGYSLERALGWYNSGSPVINSYARTVAKRYREWAKQDGEEPIG